MSMYYRLFLRRYIYTTISFWLIQLFFLGDYTQIYGNARITNASCLLTDYSSFCYNECQPPASCSPITGKCQCPTSNYTLVEDATNNTLQTCLCPGDPFFYYNGSSCVTFDGRNIFLNNHLKFIYSFQLRRSFYLFSAHKQLV
jgi:hypothetical protein